MTCAKSHALRRRPPRRGPGAARRSAGAAPGRPDDRGKIHHAVAHRRAVEVSRAGEGRTKEQATYLAGLSTGFWKDMGELQEIRKVDRRFVPVMEASERERLLAGWKRAVRCARVYGE